jgi:hypothetical protein
LGGRKPKPPSPGPRDKDQYHFTDPDSPIMSRPHGPTPKDGHWPPSDQQSPDQP